MDPLTAFSLVCGVIQVVDFSTKILLKCKELYQEGSLSEYRELEDLTNHLVGVRDKLELTTVKQNAGILGAAEDQSLLEVAGQCSKTADHLVEKFRSLKIEGTHKKRQAVLKTVKLLWEKGELRDIQRRLDGYRNVLDTQILVNLRCVCFGYPLSSLWHLKLICPDRYENRQRLELASSQHSKDFQNLDQKVQDLINIVSQEPKSFEELSDLILDENKKTKEDISNEFREHERRQAEREQHTHLLDSLWFAEMLVREETIADAHRKTFRWIFDESGRAVLPWNNFVTWLENGEGIYWISGKAGSGKSTLMNFLCQHERTKEALEIWSGTKDILTAKFFFWSAGIMMQKNFDGFLRSLLWQILMEFPDIDVLPSRVESRSEQKRRTAPYSQGSLGIWTKRRLHETLQETINKVRGSCYLCFFIDGLDEFDDDKDDLIDFVLDLVSNTGVKVCLSSRPDKEFQDAFGSYARLRLQDLTHEDIRQFVDDRFQEVPQLVSMASENEYEMNQVKERIVERAEGVFLWVSLAVKDQIRGLRNEDSPEQLQERLARLPSEVEGIYARMLHRIDKTYLREASIFLMMALSDFVLSVLQLALASYPGLEDMLLSADEISEQQIVSLCQSTRNKLITRCVGLLEVQEPSGWDIEGETISTSSDEQLEASSEVDTSAFDFQRDNRDDFDRENEPTHPHREFDKRGPASSSKPKITDAEILDLELDTTVNFVHRTAADFLKNPGPGKAFLDTNSSPVFDPQVQYLKAKLGGLRLTEELTLREGINWNSRRNRRVNNIDRIMREVADLEDSTRMPHVRLCELIDRTMSNLDRKHPFWSSGSHWCTRWGQLTEMKTPRQEIPCSDSIQKDMTISATSPITNLGNRGAVQTDPRTFLGFAASHGLSLYVNHVLDCREKRVDSEDLDDLLCCSIFGYRPFPYDIRPLTLAPELLSRGANPNARLTGETIWEHFLGCMARNWQIRVSFEFARISGFSKTLALATIAFIEHGADLGTIWSESIKLDLIGQGECPIYSCSFDLQASALSVIELGLKDEPEWPPIRRMCNARGAVRYSRCTTIKFVLQQRTAKGKRLAKRFNLSEQESKDFVEILELWTNDGKSTPILTRRLSEFYLRLDTSRTGASSTSSMHTFHA